MNICFLDNTEFKYDSSNLDDYKLRGAEKVLINLSSELHKIGHDITVINNCYKNTLINGVKWININSYNQKDYFENNDVELTLDTISYNGLWTMISSKHFWKKYNDNEIDNLSAMGEYSLISHVGRVDKKNLDKWYEMLQEITEWQKF